MSSKNDRKTLRKSALVGAWWCSEDMIKGFTRGDNWAMARDVGNIKHIRGQHVIVNTECLWSSFMDYVDNHFPMYVGQWTKNGLCLILYRLTGAKRTLMKVKDQDKRVVGAKFELKEEEA